MAKFDIIIPFLLHCEAGIAKQDTALPYEQMFERAKRTGFSCDPDDPGGATMCGVTLNTYTAYRTANRCAKTTVDDLKNISFDEWRTILRLMFWNRCYGDEIDTQQVANAIVDWVWGSGIKAVKAVQRIVGVKADGIIGPKTIAAINTFADQHHLFDKIQEARNRFHERLVRINPKLRKFINGWRRRVSKITWKGYNYD